MLQRLPDALVPADLSAWFGEIARRAGDEGLQRATGYIHPQQWERFWRVIDLVEALGPCSVLEVGCAEGLMTAELARRAEWVHATDFCAAMLAHCPALPNVSYGLFDVERDPLPLMEPVDVTVACEVLEHLRDPRAAIERLSESCTYLVASCPVTEPLNRDTFDAERYRRESKAGDAAGHVWSMDMAGMLSLFEGYEVEHSERVGASGVVVARCA